MTGGDRARRRLQAAFLLPIIHSLVAKGDTGKVDDKLAPSAIILAPTRELARQIHGDARMLAHGAVAARRRDERLGFRYRYPDRHSVRRDEGGASADAAHARLHNPRGDARPSTTLYR